jgi:four helix bundle protein
MQFALRTVRFCMNLPETWVTRRLGGQLIDSSTSMAMNYRAAGRGPSHREFTAKLGVVLEESDESLGWLEMIAQLELARGPEVVWLLGEAKELTAIFGSSYHTAKEKDRQSRDRRSGDGRSGDINRRSPDRRSPDRRSPDSAT